MNIEQKEFVQSYELTPEMFALYDLTVKELDVIKGTIKVQTKEGSISFKRCKNNKEDFDLLLQASLYLRERGFSWIPTVIPNIFLEYCTKHQQNFYYATKWIEGRNLNIVNLKELEECGKLLGQFHKAGRGFESNAPNGLGQEQLLKECAQKIDRLKTYKKQALQSEAMKRFDRVFLRGVDEACKAYEKGCEDLRKLGYEKLLQDSLKKRQLIHGAFFDYNLIWNEEEGLWYLGDFEHMQLGTRLYDLYKFIHHCSSVDAFAVEEGKEHIIEAYDRKASLNKQEKNILEVLLQLPEGFYEISSFYYGKIRSWEEEVFLMYLNREVMRNQW